MNEKAKEKRGRSVWDANAFVVLCVMKEEEEEEKKKKKKKKKEEEETLISLTELKYAFSVLPW